MAGRQKRGKMARLEDMDDAYRDIINIPDLAPDEPVVEVHEPQDEEPVVEEPVTQESAEKPVFDIWEYGRYGPEGDFMSQQHQGPQVAYINQALGLSGDTYTTDTFGAVVEYQKKNKLEVSGRVDRETYRRL